MVGVFLFLLAFALMHFQRSETDRLAHIIVILLFGAGAIAVLIYFVRWLSTKF